LTQPSSRQHKKTQQGLRQAISKNYRVVGRFHFSKSFQLSVRDRSDLIRALCQSQEGGALTSDAVALVPTALVANGSFGSGTNLQSAVR
jgi:hypothetical protein